MTNEQRADIGQRMVAQAARQAGDYERECAESVAIDAASYLAHFCDRLGLDPVMVLTEGTAAYLADADEDGPRAVERFDPLDTLAVLLELPLSAPQERARETLRGRVAAALDDPLPWSCGDCGLELVAGNWPTCPGCGGTGPHATARNDQAASEDCKA